MVFTRNEDRSGWKRPRRRISVSERDAIQAAILRGRDPSEVASEFDVSLSTAKRIGGLGGRSK